MTRLYVCVYFRRLPVQMRNFNGKKDVDYLGITNKLTDVLTQKKVIRF